MVMINELYPEVIKICRPLIIEDEILKLCVKKFAECLAMSVMSDQAMNSTVKSKLTHINDFPVGQELGNAIGLDFCGRVFRVVYNSFKADKEVTTVTRLYEIPEAKLTGSGYKLIEYVARCISNFMDTTDIKDEKVVLGVAISFPVEQESLQDAKLLQWTKGFRLYDFEGADFFGQLKVALKKYSNTKNMYVVGITTDAAACLLAGIFKDPATRIGLILGADTNACYVEKYKNMTLYTGDGMRSRTALNLELRCFGDDGCLDFIKSEFDMQVDMESHNPGKYTLDKLISATYMGELCRLCIVKLTEMGMLLYGDVTMKLSTPGSLSTRDVAEMEMDDEKKTTRCKKILRRLGYREISDADCIQIRFICRCFARRSSNLIAACLAALINRMETKEVNIVAEGSLIKEFPNYQTYLLKKITKLKRPDVRFVITLSDKEDVALGASLIANMYKEGIIKIEDKYRALPPFKVERCGYKQTGIPCTDCHCPPKEFCFGKCIEKFHNRSELQFPKCSKSFRFP